MDRRYLLDGPALRRTRKACGYSSARLLAAATRMSARTIYHLESGRSTIAESDYRHLLDLFGLKHGALLTGAPCPHCGHTTAEQVPDVA